MNIDTAKGSIPLEQLIVVTEMTKVQCGISYCTKYFYKDELVRQDVNITVDPTYLESYSGDIFKE